MRYFDLRLLSGHSLLALRKTYDETTLQAVEPGEITDAAAHVRRRDRWPARQRTGIGREVAGHDHD